MNDSIAHELTLDGYRLLRIARPDQLPTRPSNTELNLLIFTSTRAGESTPRAAGTAHRRTRSQARPRRTCPVDQRRRGASRAAPRVRRRRRRRTALAVHLRGATTRACASTATAGALSSAGVIQFGALRIDTNAYEASFASVELYLSSPRVRAARSPRARHSHRLRQHPKPLLLGALKTLGARLPRFQLPARLPRRRTPMTA